jgi:hypothetical protein
MSEKPLLAVIIPLADHRGWAVRCIESFSQCQTAPRDRFRLIVVAGPGEDPQVVAGVRELLTDADLLFASAQENLHAMYNEAAAIADCPWLLMTESHCLAEPNCVAALLERIACDDAELVSCASVGENANSFAALEQRLFEEAWVERSQRGAGGGVVIRGFAIRRESFLGVGGFATQFGHFAELLLGARLADAHARATHAPEAVVRHGNTSRRADLAPSLRDYGRGEIACRNALPVTYCETRFGVCHAWRRAQTESRFRTHLRLFGARLELAWAMTCFWATWPIARLRFAAFRRLWQRLLRLGRAEALAQAAGERQALPLRRAA